MFKKKAASTQKAHTPSIADYQFHIDVVTPELISGWAVNKQAGKSATIEVRNGKQVIWQTSASQAREDLAQAGLGDCAYSITPDIKALTADIDSVDLYIDGYKANEASFPLVMQALKPEDYTCHVDVIDGAQVNGWAKYQSLDGHRVEVEIRADGITLGSTIAEHLRPDLKEANIGDGQYGFKLMLDAGLFPAATVSGEIYLDGKPSGVEPVEISIDANAFERAKFVAKFASQIGDFSNILIQEQQRINAQIAELSEANQPTSLNVVTNIAIDNIAELSARMNVLERVIAEHLLPSEK